jgi:hypothetical protein
MRRVLGGLLFLWCVFMGGQVYAQCLGNIFTDVNTNTVSEMMCEYIERFSTLGITTGYPDGTYRPSQNVTRGQMATFIMRTIDNVITASSCPEGSAIRAINPDGTVICEMDDAGGTPSGSVTSLDGASAVGTSSNYSRGDHKHGIAAGAITGTHIMDGTITNADISPTAAIDIAKLSGVASSTHNHDAAYVNEGQANSISNGMIQNSAVTKGKISATGGTSGQVLGTDGSNLVWQGASTGVGWVDDGTSVRLATITDNVGIGIDIPAAKLHVAGDIRLNSGGSYTTVSTGNDTRLNLYSNTSAGDSRSWIELWGSDTTRAGELTLAGTYVDMRYGSTNASAGNVGMRLTSDGNVGIGTPSPESKLHVAGLNPYISVDNTSGDQAGFIIKKNNAERWKIGWSEGNNYLFFSSAINPRHMSMLIDDTTGNVGIGNLSAPDEKLSIGGGNLELRDATGSKILRLRTTGDALDMDITGANLYLNGDDGNIMLVHNDRKNVGIGTTNPWENVKLDVYSTVPINTDDDFYPGAASFHHHDGYISSNALLAYSGFGVQANGWYFDFYATGYGTHYGPFTGGHEVRLSSDFSVEVKPGMIVSVTGKTLSRQLSDGTISVSCNMPDVMLSKQPRDKTVFGVFVKEILLPQNHWHKSKGGERFASVNALGEGKVWVSNINGDIEAGDYITTSSIPGYGQKQDDDILRNYTLGKAIETVDWDEVTETVEYNGQRFKVYLIGVVYTSG